MVEKHKLNTGLVLYCFTPHWEYLAHMETPRIVGDELQNFSLCPAPKAAQQGGILIMPHLLRHRVSVFAVSFNRQSHSDSDAFYEKQRVKRT